MDPDHGRLVRTAAWLLVPAIAVLSTMPPWLRPDTGLPHHLEHFAVFLLLGFAFGLAYPKSLRLAVLAPLAFAALSELAQLIAPGRHARLGEFLADVLGIAAGFALASVSARLRAFAWPALRPAGHAALSRPSRP